MAIGIEGSKGILYAGEQTNTREDGMALGIEGSKGILITDGTGRGIREAFQELTWGAACGELSFAEFAGEVRRLPPRVAVSAFVNAQCAFGCPYCYLRQREQFEEGISEVSEIAAIANAVGASDFSIVGMEPLETWSRTQELLLGVHTSRRALITNASHVTPAIARWLATHDVCVDFSIGGEARSYERTLEKVRIFADAGVKATASCMVGAGSVDPLRVVRDVSNFGFPLIFFPFCGSGEAAVTSEEQLLAFTQKLLGGDVCGGLQATVLCKVDFLSPGALRAVWRKVFAPAHFTDLRLDLDEGFLVRQMSDRVLFGAYPFPGEFINRIRIDADGALTTCHHMQLPLLERLAVRGDLRYQPDAWLDIPEVRAYHEQYWEEYHNQQ